MKNNIALIGFMGCGKSTIGPLLAEKIGWRFLDLDDLIVERAGRRIADIFKEQGEEAFRDYETAALKEAVRERNLVLAGGGGVILRRENVKVLRDNFHVIYLNLPLKALKKRLLRSKRRPLLQVKEPEKRVEDLYKFRRVLYEDAADQIFEVSGESSAAENTERLRRTLSPAEFDFKIARLNVNLAERAYEIIIGRGVMAAAGNYARQVLDFKRAVVISNDIVGPLYGQTLRRGLQSADIDVDYLEVGSGESYKSLTTAAKLYEDLLELGADRDTVLLALGGGVVGDLVGFVASTFMRGLPLIQIPTTLLAQVDSSVGGKTAVNLPRAKNIVGTFYQPRLVLSDMETLATLPARELRAGWAEVIKYGFLVGEPLLSLIESEIDAVSAGEYRRLRTIIYHCCAYKAAVVAEDEADRGRRAVLNYGHTIGHAVEAASAYKVYNHGEAVAVGMYGAARLAVKLGYIDESVAARHLKLLTAAGLPTAYRGLEPSVVYKHLKLDKKRQAGRDRFILLKDIGKPAIVKISDKDLIAETIAEAREA